MPEEQIQGAPARISLDDLIETVTRGVLRAMAAEAEVTGFAMSTSGQPQGGVRPPVASLPLGGGHITIGLIFNPAAGGFQAPQ
jgi:hypothetical protein